jgi:hypothetical protein
MSAFGGHATSKIKGLLGWLVALVAVDSRTVFDPASKQEGPRGHDRGPARSSRACTHKSLGPMSAFGGKADITRT